MERKKGFTLIELIAVITLLAIIILVTVPVIINTLGKTEQKEYEDFEKLVVNAAELYVERNRDLYPEINEVGNSVEIDASTLISEGYLSNSLNNPVDNRSVENYKIVVEFGQDEMLTYRMEEK